MKRLALLLALLLLPCVAACAESYALPGAQVTVEDGLVTEITAPGGSLALDGLYVDVGCDGAFLQGSVGYQRFWDMSTWTLATIVPKVKAPAAPETQTARLENDALVLEHDVEGLHVTITLSMVGDSLRVSSAIRSDRAYVCEIQGVHFQLRGVTVPETTTFQFPGNTPAGIYALTSLKPFAVRQTDYCAPLTQVTTGEGQGFNVLFLDTEEKWSTGVYQDREGKLSLSFLAMAEGLLNPGEVMQVGEMYVQLTGEDPYAPVQALYQALGYHTPETTWRSGPVYSCHPAGTMDSGFRDVKTMRAYAESLSGLADMGIENVWVLPIFTHTGRGVYEPMDQQEIDPRYGSDEDVRFYVDTAHDAGIKVLFDYVPHGPYPEDPLAQAHPEWCSVARSGEKQIEWDCVSFDMANTAYQQYTTALVKDHVARFGIDGGRIDCAMGGLSNWAPQAGNRASSSSLKGGVEIVSAIRAGFTESGVTPVLLPENFHPVPFYAAITDIFYDMPLYRVMHDLRSSGADETTFATTLARWLDAEHRASVPGQLKLRFLGNHDTVSWTWDQMRATAVYGTAKAEALWTLMSTIDGVPFLYMGDEDSSLYHFAGDDLTEFFTGLFAARKQYLSDDMDTRYLLGDSTVVAFTRENGAARRLVLVNLGKDPVTYPLSESATVLYGSGTLEASAAVLPGYGCLLLDLPLT